MRFRATRNKHENGADGDIDWVDGSLPFSRRFGDFYHSRAGGPGQTAHVFVEGNDLPARWPDMDECTIGELGFGIGLNFVETVRHWRAHAHAGARLRFIAFEQYPVSRSQMARALSRWPECAELANVLVEYWRPDYEMLSLPFGRGVELFVFMDDANIRLPSLEFQTDAWYLDGFAPSRNPELWSADLMAGVCARTVPGGTFSTYSASTKARKNLNKAGFEVRKRAGYAGKREMLCGAKPE